MALEDDKHQQSCEDPQSVPTLMKEIIVIILLRLPVDSLLRFRSVCKLWCSLISDPHFVKCHLSFSTSNNHHAHHRLMFNAETNVVLSSTQNIHFKTCNLYDVLHDNSVKALDLDSPFKNRDGKYVEIIGSSNGLLCMSMEKDSLFIWNPSTRKLNRLPYYRPETQRQGYLIYGFGYEEYTDDYKVVEFSHNFKAGAKPQTFFKMYSLKNGSWKELGASRDFLFYGDHGKFYNGSLHWAASTGLRSSSSWTIVSLDLARETYGEVLQPLYGEGDKDLTLGSLKEGMCVLCNYKGIRVDLWVMKVYGVRDSWTKLVSIPYLTDPGIDKFSVPLCISEDGNFLLKFRSTLIVYDSKNNSFSEFQNVDGCLQPCIFVESLVSPDAPADLGERF